MRRAERLERIQNATAVLKHVQRLAPGCPLAKIIKQEIRDEKRLLP